MKREILFRGKRVDNGKWVEGDLMQNRSLKFISLFSNGVNRETFEVIPETVGQFTGLTDKNKKKIFEGDVLLSKSWGAARKQKSNYHVVEWRNNKWVASGYNGEIKVNPEIGIKSDWEIVGTIYDNPELLP